MNNHFSPLVAILFLLLACNPTKKITGQQMDPVMHFEPKEFDLGAVKKGETKTMVFEFTNTSQEDLTIDFVDAGCHCTEVEAPEGKAFKPGEKGSIKVIYYSEREEELGPHEKSPLILLKRTDPQTDSQMIREITFTLTLSE